MDIGVAVVVLIMNPCAMNMWEKMTVALIWYTCRGFEKLGVWLGE